MVLPTVPFGVQTGQLDIPFCLNINPSTQAAILGDLAHCLDGHGVRKLVILNGHGGNDFRQMIRELQPKVKLFLCTVNWYKIVDPKPYFVEAGDHAGEMETSLMMHFVPDLVLPLSEAGDGHEKKARLRAFREGWAWTPRPWTKISADTGVGDPRASTAEKGNKYAEAVARQLGQLLIDLAAANPASFYE
jgi:creatinine amidohydrolase